MNGSSLYIDATASGTAPASAAGGAGRLSLLVPLRLARVAWLLALFVVTVGGWTRLNDAGLSCPDWPGCYGELVLPATTEAQMVAQSRFPHQPIDLSRGWLEMGHRYLAGTLGLMVLAIAVTGFRRRRQAGYPVRLGYALLLLVVIQALFGMWTVTLKLLPQIVTLHLIGGMLTVALLTRLVQRLAASSNHSPGVSAQPLLSNANSDTRAHIVDSDLEQRGSRPLRPMRPWIALAGLLLLVQIALGGWTSANYAGWACDHWFSCAPALDGRAFGSKGVEGEGVESKGFESKVRLDFAAAFSLPSADQGSYLGGRKSVEARAAIQLTHRLVALMLTAYLLWLLLRIGRATTNSRVGGASAANTTARWILVLVLLQAGLGILNVHYGLPLGLAFGHHLGALLLLLALMRLYHQCDQCPRQVRWVAAEVALDKREPNDGTG